VLKTSKVNRNVAEGDNYTYNPAGGAISLDYSAGEIVDCELLQNVARGGKYASAGTAPQARHCVPSPCTNGVRRPMHPTSFVQVL
jgi:hypothetical protein